MNSSIPNPSPYQTHLNAIKTQEYLLNTQKCDNLPLSTNPKAISRARASIDEITKFVKDDQRLNSLEIADLNYKIRGLNQLFYILSGAQNLSFCKIY